jgi:hypothetical protein
VPPWRLAAVSLGLAAVFGACTGSPFLEPEIVGVVAETEPRPGGALDVTLVDGRSVRIDMPGQTNLDGGAEPKPGALLLVGTTDRGQMFEVLFPDSDPPVKPCWTAARWATRIDDVIQFDYGLRLPTAPGFDGSLGTADGRFANPSHRFCVNESGAITAYR